MGGNRIECGLFPIVNFLIILGFNLWVVFWGYAARYSDPGMACSGDFYTKDDEPEPYLWSSGRVIGNIVTFYLWLIGIIVVTVIIVVSIEIIYVTKNPNWRNRR